MENKLLTYPVMLPTEQETRLYKHPKEGLVDLENDMVGGNDWKHQHLYLVSDREIKEGDLYITETTQGKTIFRCTGVEKETDYVIGSPLNSSYKDARRRENCQRIEATTDPSLGLPLIPQSFIEEWVKKQGKIESVYLKTSSIAVGWPIPAGDGPNGEVIILPVKESLSREEALEMILNFAENCDWLDEHDWRNRTIEWFDKHY